MSEFYENFCLNPHGEHVSFVSETKITLSSLFLGAILRLPYLFCQCTLNMVLKILKGFLLKINRN